MGGTVPLRAAILLAALLFLFPTANTFANSGRRRFAFVVGANDGGRGRARLRYAVKDARAMRDVLVRLGGVQPGDGVLLVEPTQQKLLTRLVLTAWAVTRARGNGAHIEFLFYYSGHADEEGILLGEDKLTYSRLKDFILKVDAHVRIAIIDSCSSGAFTRVKGGRKKAPFRIDTSHRNQGFAFLTSSSSDEDSQESDRIGGSFFTHYLLAGLRGAADHSRDGRVTLNEAYQFAYHETLARTEKTITGPQHPNYYIKMSGTGDVVMTELVKSDAALVLHQNIRGRISIRNQQRALVAEFSKPRGKEISIGLGRGRYYVLNRRGKGLFQSDVSLSSGARHLVHPDSFRPAQREFTVSRGSRPHHIPMRRLHLPGNLRLFLDNRLYLIRPTGRLPVNVPGATPDLYQPYPVSLFAPAYLTALGAELALDPNFSLLGRVGFRYTPLLLAYPGTEQARLETLYHYNFWHLSLGARWYPGSFYVGLGFYYAARSARVTIERSDLDQDPLPAEQVLASAGEDWDLPLDVGDDWGAYLGCGLLFEVGPVTLDLGLQLEKGFGSLFFSSDGKIAVQTLGVAFCVSSSLSL